jgi:Protein of unknown function (DUF3619)
MNHPQQRHLDVLMERQGLRLAAQLNASTDDLPHEVIERLRAARERAVASRKVELIGQPAVYGLAGSLALGGWGGDERMSWMGRLGCALALCLLVFGMMVISEAQSELRARELAQVDMALLTDDLPPAAFADPGFLQYLQSEEL